MLYPLRFDIVLVVIFVIGEYCLFQLPQAIHRLTIIFRTLSLNISAILIWHIDNYKLFYLFILKHID